MGIFSSPGQRLSMIKLNSASLLLLIVVAIAAVAEPSDYYFLHFEVGQVTYASTDGAATVTDNFSFETWLYLDETPVEAWAILCGQQAYALDFVPEGISSHRWWFHTPENELDPGGWSIVLRTDQGVVATPPIDSLPVGAWTHVAATYDGTILRFFVNGNEVASIPQAGTISVLNDGMLDVACQYPPKLLMGVSGGTGGRGGNGFKGALRDLALWDHALDSGELAARSSDNVTGNEPGLLHFWPFDSGENQEPNLVTGGPPMILGESSLDEGPFGEPEWLLTEPFYAIREDWIEDLPPSGGSEGLISWGVIDLNQDGLDDLLYNGDFGVCRGDSRPFRVLLSDGTGHFFDSTSSIIEGPVPEPRGAFRSQVADFNGDGLLDLFSGNIGFDDCYDVGWTNSLLLTNEAGKLEDASDKLLGAPCTLAVPQYEGQAPCNHGGGNWGRPPGIRYPDTNAELGPLDRDFTHSTASGDIDDDGDVDLYVGNLGDLDAPYFLINDGSGNFVANWDAVPTEVRGKNFAESHIADIDGDGKQDLVVCCKTIEVVGVPGTPILGGVFWGDGSGDFSATERMTFPRARAEWAGSNGGFLPVDIDGDGDKDIILTTENPSDVFGNPAENPDASPVFVQVLVNHGNRQFVDETAKRIAKQTSLLMWIIAITELDINADGCPDFFIYHAGWYWNENLYVNDCKGNFTPVNRAVVGKMRQLIPIDAHGDGDLDFISYSHPFLPSPGDFAILEQIRPVDVRRFFPIIHSDSFEEINVIIVSPVSEPTVSTSIPASPNGANNPKIFGSGEAGSIIRLYSDNTCSNLIGTGTSEEFNSTGLGINVSDESVTTVYATATNDEGTTSACSSSYLSYTHVDCDIGSGTWAAEARDCITEDCLGDEGRWYSWDGKGWCRALITQEGGNWTVTVPPGASTFDFWADWGAWDLNDCGDGVTSISIPVCGLDEAIYREGVEQHFTCDVAGQSSITIQKATETCEYVIIGNPHFY